MKSKTTALILSILVGGLGVDRFYLGYTGMGVLKLLTGGCFGILWIIDIVNIATGKLAPADGSGYDEDIAATSAPVQPATSVYDELEKVAKLHDQGVLSDEEFAKMKADLLERL
jgi:TM2 domain-containing membrane protein YozV